MAKPVIKKYGIVRNGQRVYYPGSVNVHIEQMKSLEGKEHHEQHYVIDGGWRQQQFKDLIATAQVKPAVEGESLKIKDAKGHRVWLSIKAIHTVNDATPVMEDGEPIIEYFIFKMNPYIDNGKRPKIAGDPLDNKGIAWGEFVEYKNIAVIMKERNRVNTVPDEFKTRPLTNDQIERLEAAKEIIKNVESGIKPEKPVEQPKIDDIDWGEEPNF